MRSRDACWTQKRRTECRREVVSACLKLVEIHGREKRLRSKHFDIRRRLNDAIEQESKYKEESEKAVQDVLVTRGFAKERENAGQEKQLELTRCVGGAKVLCVCVERGRLF